jgi:hypothetical protein
MLAVTGASLANLRTEGKDQSGNQPEFFLGRDSRDRGSAIQVLKLRLSKPYDLLVASPQKLTLSSETGGSLPEP